jgi:hypothetical protein
MCRLESLAGVKRERIVLHGPSLVSLEFRNVAEPVIRLRPCNLAHHCNLQIYTGFYIGFPLSSQLGEME